MPVLHLRIAGKVQGVGFRWFVCEQALELGLSGWVRNTRSGKVELAASGASAQLAALEAAVRRGPSGATVTAVDHLAPPNVATYPSPFRIEP